MGGQQDTKVPLVCACHGCPVFQCQQEPTCTRTQGCRRAYISLLRTGLRRTRVREVKLKGSPAGPSGLADLRVFLSLLFDTANLRAEIELYLESSEYVSDDVVLLALELLGHENSNVHRLTMDGTHMSPEHVDKLAGILATGECRRAAARCPK